jgi:hypothetical protein
MAKQEADFVKKILLAVVWIKMVKAKQIFMFDIVICFFWTKQSVSFKMWVYLRYLEISYCHVGLDLVCSHKVLFARLFRDKMSSWVFTDMTAESFMDWILIYLVMDIQILKSH